MELYQGSGALLDLHGPQNGPQNGSGEANSRGPFIKKGPPGSFDGPNWSFFFIDLWTTVVYFWPDLTRGTEEPAPSHKWLGANSPDFLKLAEYLNESQHPPPSPTQPLSGIAKKKNTKI